MSNSFENPPLPQFHRLSFGDCKEEELEGINVTMTIMTIMMHTVFITITQSYNVMTMQRGDSHGFNFMRYSDMLQPNQPQN